MVVMVVVAAPAVTTFTNLREVKWSWGRCSNYLPQLLNNATKIRRSPQAQ